LRRIPQQIKEKLGQSDGVSSDHWDLSLLDGMNSPEINKNKWELVTTARPGW
jgi:hypothetical protein